MPDKPPVDDDPDAPPTEEELARAGELRAALEGAPGSNDDAHLARSLQAAWSPSGLSADRHRRILDDALARRSLSSSAFRSTRAPRRGLVVRVAFGAGAVVALAAGVAVVVRTQAPAPATYEAAAIATSRSTQPLFAEAFARRGGETSRIDRIALARQADLRDNEFARWGAR
jgi:hypothetical protein